MVGKRLTRRVISEGRNSPAIGAKLNVGPPNTSCRIFPTRKSAPLLPKHWRSTASCLAAGGKDRLLPPTPLYSNQLSPWIEDADDGFQTESGLRFGNSPCRRSAIMYGPAVRSKMEVREGERE